MEKGHYGQYTGNARHARKMEMIHDRELIYDTKQQLHRADKDYKADSPVKMCGPGHSAAKMVCKRCGSKACKCGPIMKKGCGY